MDVVTKGILPTYWNLPSSVAPGSKAILQVYHIKPMVPKTADPNAEVDRWRVILCDGEYFAQTMVGTNNRNLITEGIMQRYSIVQVLSAQANSINGKRLLIVADLKVLTEYGTPDKVNENPTSIDAVESQANTNQAQPQGISGNNFYGQQQRAMPPPPAPNNMQRYDSKQANIYPIGSLSPYAHKWTIKARVTTKGAIRSWHNANSSGRLFSVVFLDESGEIRATAFSSVGDQFDQWYEMLEEDGVYYVSNPCKVGLAKKNFSGGVKNDYELNFERDTKIERSNDQGGIPSVVYNFTNVENLQSVEVGTIIDTIGVIKMIGPADEIISKTTQKPFTKRELTIADDSHHEVRVTIWGDGATNFNSDVESIVAFKGVKVGDFGGRSLSLTSGGSMKINPDIQEAHKLKGWYDAQGRTETFLNHASLNPKMGGGRSELPVKTCLEVKDENLGMKEEPDRFSIKSTVQFITHQSPLWYASCRTEAEKPGEKSCKRKVVESEINPGEWRCENCNKTWDRPTYRYILRICAVDHTGSLWFNLFDEQAQVLLGKTADELHALSEEVSPEMFKYEVDEMALWKTWNFRVLAKLDTYQDQARVRYQVLSIAPMGYKEEANKLADKLKSFGLMADENSLFV